MINILVKGNCKCCLHFYSSRRTAELPYSTQRITTCTVSKMMTIISSFIHFVAIAYSFCSLCMIGCQWHHSIRKYPGTPRDIEPKSKLNISVYLMQPLWRFELKTTRTKIGTLRISHASSKIHRDMRSRSFDHKDQLEENRSCYWQDLVTEYRAYKFSPEVSEVLLLFVSVSF